MSKRIFFGFSGGIFSLTLAFAERAAGFAIFAGAAFALPFPFAICGCATQLESGAQRDETSSTPSFELESGYTPPYSHLLAYSPYLAGITRPTDSSPIY